MAKASPIISNFNAGEFSPLMAGRVDIKYYQNGCRKVRNFIPTPQGPSRRRPGTRFVAEVKDSADRTWLSRFEFNVEQAYVIEWGDLYARFFSNHGVVGAPFELATPYAIADLTGSDGTFQLQAVQSNDVQYVCHPSYQIRKLTRTGAATFTIAAFLPEGGPFKDVDPDNTITVYASAATGAGITLTASSAIFLAGHVGSLFLLEQKNVDGIKMWEAGKVVALNDLRRSDGKNYKALNAATTGTVKPTHTVGAKYDGDAGVQWEFQDPGYGWVKITAIGGGGTTATVDVISRLPDGAVLVANATTRWAFGAWSDVEGWPDYATFFRERLVFSRGTQGWASVVRDYENFRERDDGGLITPDMAFSFDITSDRANQIEWMAPSNDALLVGTAGDEHAITPITTTEAFGPGNAQARKQSEYGSRNVPICRVGEGVVFAQRAGRKIRDMKLAESVNERWTAADITVLAEHVTKGGVIDMCYQQEPDSTIWAIRNDGALLGMILNREQDVRGWHPHRIGGTFGSGFAVVEASVSIPSPDSDRDEAWLIVKRTINGATKRYVEWMEYHHEEGDDPEDSFYVDSGLTLDNVKNAILTPGAGATVKGTTGVNFNAPGIFVAGDVNRYIHYRYSTVSVTGKVTWNKAIAKITAFVDANNVTCTVIKAWPSLTAIAANGWRMTVTTMTGLSHLEGQSVQILGDGAVHPNLTVTGGSITLQWPVSKAHVGLGATAVISPMPLEAAAADGTAQGKTQRVSRCGIGFHETLGAKYGRDEDAQLDQIMTRGGSDAMDEAPPYFTGIKTVDWPDGYEGPALITVVQDQPLPCTLTLLAPQLVTYDDR